MFLSDKERTSTFLIGILLGCLIVAGLLQRRSHRLDEHNSIRHAPVPEWAEPLPEAPAIPDSLQLGKIVAFQKGDKNPSRSWILQYEKNYPFVLIEEDASSTPMTYRFIAADSIRTTPRSGVSYRDYREKLPEVNLFPREHFKRHNVISVGIHQEKPSIENLYKALETLKGHPLIETAEFDFITIREPEESRFQLPGQFQKKKENLPSATSPTGS